MSPFAILLRHARPPEGSSLVAGCDTSSFAKRRTI
jgi:hypothetical protein